MSNAEALYRLQIKIKANDIDKKRRDDEIVTHYKKCEDQIKRIFISLNALSKRIWAIINNSHYSQNFFDQLPDIQNIDNKQATEDESNNLISRNQSPFNLLHLYDEKSKFLSNTAFLEVLASFNYLWSEEMAAAFCGFFLTLNDDQMKQFGQCFLVQPNIQIYFKTSLRPIFAQISNNNCNDLFEQLLSSLEKFSVLIPLFFINALKDCQNKDRLFASLLKTFISFHDLFGIASYEVSFYFHDSIASLLSEIDNYYVSGKFSEFISNKILTSNAISKNCSFVPKESLLNSTFQHLYKPFVLTDELSQPHGNIHIRKLKFVYLSKQDSHTNSNIVKINEDAYIRALQANTKANNPAMTQNLAITLIERFLSKANLVKIENITNNNQKRSQQTLDLIRELAELSSVFRDPELERDFDKLSAVLNRCDMSISHIANIYDAKCRQNSDKEKSLDPIDLISHYNQQRTFLNKAIEMLDNMNQDAIEAGIFRKLLKLEKVISNTKSAAEFLQNPQEFVDFYLSNAQTLMKSVPFQFVFNANWESKPNLISPPEAAYESLFLFLTYEAGMYKANSYPQDTIRRNSELSHKLETEDCKALINIEPDKSTKPYFDNPDKIQPFIQKLTEIFGNDDPNQLLIPGLMLDKLNRATELLIQILNVDGMKEIGMDQLLPICILGLAFSKPKNLLLFSYFLSNVLAVAMMDNTFKPIPSQKESFIVVLYNSVLQVFESLV